MKIEITKGARTVADPHPSVDPDVTAKMNKIKAAKVSLNVE